VKSKANKPMATNDEYARAADFCAVFTRDAESFYQLAFLLTGSERRAWDCILMAMEDCNKAKVFKPWAASWSRLAVIERALKSSSGDSMVSSSDAERDSNEARAILQLKGIDRFVFVLSVLEKYSIRDCAILLRTNKREIAEIKTRTLREVSASIGAPVVRAESPIQLTA
jgi:hypothetical protein